MGSSYKDVFHDILRRHKVKFSKVFDYHSKGYTVTMHVFVDLKKGKKFVLIMWLRISWL